MRSECANRIESQMDKPHVTEAGLSQRNIVFASLLSSCFRDGQYALMLCTRTCFNCIDWLLKALHTV